MNDILCGACLYLDTSPEECALWGIDLPLDTAGRATRCQACRTEDYRILPEEDNKPPQELGILINAVAEAIKKARGEE